MTLPSYTRGPQDKPLLAMTIGAAFDQTVARYAEREALVVRHQHLRYSWAQLAEQVDRCARALLAIGMQPGERLGIWAPNCAEWCITQFASAKVGVILVNIRLICADAFKTSDYHAMLGELLPELAGSALGALHSRLLPELRGVISLGRTPAAGMLGWARLLERLAPSNCAPAVLNCSSTNRSTSSTPPAPPASPRARPSATTTSSTTATSSAKAWA